MVTMPYGPPTDPIHTLGPWVGIVVVAAVGAAVGVWYARRVAPVLLADEDLSPVAVDAGSSTPESTGNVTSAGGEARLSADLSRRKMLGAVATVGGAAAFGGFGTDAFFSDAEEFANNSLVAGELDLKVDWEEHYSDWSDDETAGVGQTSTVPASGLVGFPSTAPVDQQTVFVEDPDAFLANTAIEAFPDPDPTTDPTAVSVDDYDARQTPAADDSALCDLPADLTDVLSHPYRTGGVGAVTVGDEPNPQTTAAGDPLVDVSDVKPGDFGEVTFSIHLCGNPGYVWLTGALREARENGVTEPEADAPAEEAGTVELLDAVQAAVWYDTGRDGRYGADFADKDEDGSEGDNRRQGGESFVTLTGSLRNVLTLLEGGALPLDFEPVAPAGTRGGDAVESATVDDTDRSDVYTSADLGVSTPRDISCSELGKLLEPPRDLVGTKLDADVIEPSDFTTGNGGVLTVETADVSGGSVRLSTDFPVEAVMLKSGRKAGGETAWVWPDGGVILDGVSFEVSQAISHVEVCYGVDGGGGGQQNGGRQCFPNSTTAYIGFEWWLPMHTGNEVQTDVISFDLGFYSEQCRHNDGRLGNDGAGGAGDGDGDGEQAIKES